MLAAIPATFIHGERYQISGPAGGADAPTTVAGAQAFFNQFAPGAVQVVSLSTVGTTTTMVLDWTGPTGPTSATAIGNLPIDITDLGPSPASPAASSSSSSTGTYVAIGAGVLALGALVWYAMKHSRQYAHNPLALGAGERVWSDRQDPANALRQLVYYKNHLVGVATMHYRRGRGRAFWRWHSGSFIGQSRTMSGAIKQIRQAAGQHGRLHRGD